MFKVIEKTGLILQLVFNLTLGWVLIVKHPSASEKPVTNQGFNLNPYFCIKDWIFFDSFVTIVVVVVFVEYKCLFRIW